MKVKIIGGHHAGEEYDVNPNHEYIRCHGAPKSDNPLSIAENIINEEVVIHTYKIREIEREIIACPADWSFKDVIHELIEKYEVTDYDDKN